jgi:superfamily II DNA or RNA helicase
VRNRPAETGEIIAVLEGLAPGERWYKVRFANGTRSVSEQSLVDVGIPQDPEQQFAEGVVGGMPEFRLLLTFLRLKERSFTDQLRSLRAARLVHLPFQYKPLLKFLESDHQRILIADEVGLGKTIETGLILSELRSRHELHRVLIVVPSNLLIKWQTELRERFDFEFEIRDNRWIRQVLLQPAREGHELPVLQALCGLESLRLLAEELDSIRPPLDLVIVDEAHRMRNESSLSHQLGRILSDCAEGMVLLSATPMQTSSADLYNLLRILLGDEAGSFGDFQRDLKINEPIVRASSALARNEKLDTVRDCLFHARGSLATLRPSDLPLVDECLKKAELLDDDDHSGRAELLALVSRLNLFGSILTRTRKRAVFGNVAPRVAKTVPLQFTPEEMEMYEAVTQDTRRIVANGKWTGEAFAAIMRQRKAASCLAVLHEEFSSQINTDEDAASALGAELVAEDLSVDGTRSKTQSSFKEIANAATLMSDSKLDALLRLLDDLRAEDPLFKLVIFTTFKATIRHLGAKLSERGWAYEVLTGDVLERTERVRRVNRVRNDASCQILLATEVGSEGLDLQFCANLVNYDLPWNPMTVEQRIGRLDRIGQRATEIRIFNLAVDGTIEQRILKRLYSRLQLFESSIGALEVILGERIQKLALELMCLSPQEQERRLDEERLALSNMQFEAARLDEQATNLLGDDTYYLQRLNEIEAKQGDIAQDLRAFFIDFLNREFKKATLLEDDSIQAPKVLRLTFDSELLAFMTHSNDGSGSFRALVSRYAESRDRSGVLITFAQDVAEQRPDVEFITSTHGLVRAIAKRIEEQDRTMVRAFGLACQSRRVPPGIYLLGVALQRISGLRPRVSLMGGAVSIEDGNVLDDATTDMLLIDLGRNGRSWEEARLIRERAAAYQTRAEQALIERLQRTTAQVKEENRLFVDRRIDSLRRWYGTRIQRAEAQQSTHSDERVRRMAAGKVAKLRVKLEEEIRRTEESKQVDPESRTEAYTLVQIES